MVKETPNTMCPLIALNLTFFTVVTSHEEAPPRTLFALEYALEMLLHSKGRELN